MMDYSSNKYGYIFRLEIGSYWTPSSYQINMQLIRVYFNHSDLTWWRLKILGFNLSSYMIFMDSCQADFFGKNSAVLQFVSFIMVLEWVNLACRVPYIQRKITAAKKWLRVNFGKPVNLNTDLISIDIAPPTSYGPLL